MLIPVLLTGQNEPNTKIDLPKKNIYGEAHPGVFTKVVMNYEKQFKLGEKLSWYYEQFKLGEKLSWYYRVGAGYGADIFNNKSGLGGLGGITVLTGKKNHHIELSMGSFLGVNKVIGALYYDSTNNEYFREVHYEAFIFPFFDWGYRYQKPSGGFIFRANTSLFGLGISFGYAF